ncbi:LysM peptidoglycan-binding domain-containing protein [Candidatus Saccharibacteria bacterium]|nr:LysM peptidoglycan-binding domain-containing protein [Candidatus Saccharibacteria bacterium]
MIAKKSKKKSNNFFRRNWGYILVTLGVVALAFVGSQDKSDTSEVSMNMQSIMSSNAQVSADRVSQFYMVAELADSMNLASSGLTETNYSTVVLLHQNSQSTDEAGKISKPITVNVSSISRGVIQYTVKDGESLDDIAARYGVTTDQIRWSNGLSNKNITSGQSLMIPSVPGIAYKVKNGDTVDSIASRYGSTTEAIITVNDLEKDQNLAVDSIILIPNGTLPETERPEYVVSRPTTTASTTSSYQYYASYASGNRYAYGWCTWYAWQWRHDNMPANYDLPSNMGNANTWAVAAAAAGFSVNHTPQPGDVFQTTAGWAGHVGIVQAVNDDGSVTITEMNGVAGWGRVGTSKIPASLVSSYSYIHGR